jgi:hypothetical protein
MLAVVSGFLVRQASGYHEWTADRVSSTTDLDNPKDHGSPSRQGRDIGAIIFMATVIFSLIGIAMLARNIFAAAQHLESAKRNAETVARDLAEVGAKRKIGESGIAQCESSAESAGKLTWGPCWEEIQKRPDIARLVNAMEAGNSVFGGSCDGTDDAIGRISIEKGTPWFSAGNTGVTYAASDSEDSIVGETPMRIQVCNRWGEPVKVQEVKF